MKKVLAIIPAFNEAQTIRLVVEDINNLMLNENILVDALVINDCSKDDTSSIASTLRCFLIDLPVNLGIGGSVQTGFKFAKKYNYDIAFQFDGDGQHNAAEVNKILEPILNKKADVIIGSRFNYKNQGFKSTKIRRIGIIIFQIINSLIINQKIKDNTSGFRAYNKKAIHFLSEYYPTDYPEPEAVVLLSKNNFKIMEVPVIMQERTKGASSISGIISFYYMIKVIMAILFASLTPKNRKEFNCV